MNTHEPISDEQLLLYHYHDGLDAAERARIAKVLVERPEIASRLQTLVAQLDLATTAADVPVPARTLERWHAAIERAASDEAARSSRNRAPGFLAWPALAAVSAAVIAMAVLLFKGGADSGSGESLPLMAASEDSQCECGLQWHLASAERQLAEVSATSGEERMALIDAVIAQNRMYAIAAERAGDQRLAGALRSFTPILERLAQDDAGSSESAAEMAQLSFELRVMQARLAAGAATPSPSVTAL